MKRCAFIVLALLAAGQGAQAWPGATVTNVPPVPVVPVNIIDGRDDRDSLTVIAASLGLQEAEVARIRKVSGFVGCFLPTPSLGNGALYLTNDLILTVSHIFFTPGGKRRSKCFFRTQDLEPVTIEFEPGADNTIFGATSPRAGSNDDWAIVRLPLPIPGGIPFPFAERPPQAGEVLVVITGHPAGMAKAVDKAVPVAQPCRIRRVPISSEATSFYRSDCDATGSSSGGMHLTRIDGALAFRGITITTGPWQDPAFMGAPYDERGGSVTTALGTDAAILAAGRRLAGER
jgi:hypothetical protein